MKKEGLIQPIDFILIFWILIFSIVAIFTPKADAQYMWIYIISGISIFSYLFYVILLRIDRNKMIERENRALIQVEAEVIEKDANLFFEMKQKVLENMIEAELKLLYPTAKILKNIYCPKPDGSTSEIDLIMITNDGIFLFEAKNYNARLTGNWSDEKLIAVYENQKKFEVINPVIQNSYHYQHLKKLLGIGSPYAIKNIVVLGDSITYDKEEMKTVPNYASVCKFNGIGRIVEIRSRLSKGLFKESQVNSLFDTIKEQLSSTTDKKAKHQQYLSNIKDSIKNEVFK